MSDAIITCDKLTKRFHGGGGEVVPLADLDLTIAQGDFVALMGPSGSGKTTLLNCIGGIDRPTSGRLTVAGTDLATLGEGRLAAWRAHTVGFVFQLYHLVPVLDAVENVELPLLLHGLSASERRKRALRALELVGLADRAGHFPRQLSGGQEQRVAIARAIVGSPPLLVADEPTGDLDGESEGQILDLLNAINRDLGTTIVMVTHDQSAAARARRTVHLHKGKLVGAP